MISFGTGSQYKRKRKRGINWEEERERRCSFHFYFSIQAATSNKTPLWGHRALSCVSVIIKHLQDLFSFNLPIAILACFVKIELWAARRDWKVCHILKSLRYGCRTMIWRRRSSFMYCTMSLYICNTCLICPESCKHDTVLCSVSFRIYKILAWTQHFAALFVTIACVSGGRKINSYRYRPWKIT